MIVVTGAAGFIGSCLISRLNKEGFDDIIAVDDFTKTEKAGNLKDKKLQKKIDRTAFFSWFLKNNEQISFVFHIGARTDTTEFMKEIFDELNLHYSQNIFTICNQYRIPLVYASSAATYGLGEYGYTDSHEVAEKLKPLNPYGESKNEFDKWVLQQPELPPFWAGMKFFNVYGPNEFHKGRMASVIFHAFNQINNIGKVKLFKSHIPEYKDGEQLRDFVYVKDVTDVLYFMMKTQPESGLYNLGTGKARSFNDLAKSTFRAMKLPVNIEYIDTPPDIRDKYQYFTEADMKKLRSVGFKKDFTSLEDGVEDYVVNYLTKVNYL
ncbi:MAG TPA: ADP-glyceromanno-heptose 6-epimerase [Lentimicrobium sp.]|nr:ADP-glyceromanno-heptose 6-epimerase [Lentimicrobium sp.]